MAKSDKKAPVSENSKLNSEVKQVLEQEVAKKRKAKIADSSESVKNWCFHNTKKLLKKYRNTKMCISAALDTLEDDCESELGARFDKMADFARLVDVDLSGTYLESRMRSMQQNRQMLAFIDRSVSSMRKYDRNGEEFYWIIYLKYMAPGDEKCTNDADIVNRLGTYGIKEISAPDYYYTDGDMFYAEIKYHEDLIRFEVLNKAQDISVSVEKRGNVQAMPGDIIRYDFSNTANTSNVSLEEFYWHDLLPTDAVRLNQIHTGTWSERLTYKVTYRTNLKSTYRTLEDKLSTKVDNVLECGREALRLATNEYITDIRFEFGEVEAGFHCVDGPFMYVTVLGNLPDGYQFTNRTTVGGRTEDEWIYAKDAWTTCIFAPVRGKLPKTGK